MNHPHSSPDTGRRGLLGVLLVAQLMVILDITAVNVALPDMAADLHIGAGDIGWTITSYSLLFGSLLLLGGRAADLLGRRRMFLAGLTVFTLSSLGSAVAPSEAVLFAARAGQGIGAALLSPAALSIITGTFHGPDRAKALGAWGAVGGAGAAIGVLLGGALTELDWRAIFLINLPVGLALAVAVPRVVPADPARPKWSGLDLRGAAVATASVGALVYGLSQASSAGWGSAQTLGLTGAALLGLWGFAALERRTAEPLLRIERLADRAVGGGFLMMLAAAAVLFGGFLLSSLYLQHALGMGPLETGLAFLPFAVATAAGAHLGSHVIGHLGVRGPLAAAFAVAGGGLLLLAGVDADGSYLTEVLPGMVTAGVGLGVVLVGVGVSVLTGARSDEAGMLSGLNTTGHEIGGSVGIAVLSSIAAAGGIADAFLAAGIIALAAGLGALAILPPARTFLPRMELAPNTMPIH
jgi:EmrB/QacA subfamily drug resistance transporter